jgi:hypothetical protein
VAKSAHVESNGRLVDAWLIMREHCQSPPCLENSTSGFIAGIRESRLRIEPTNLCQQIG